MRPLLPSIGRRRSGMRGSSSRKPAQNCNSRITLSPKPSCLCSIDAAFERLPRLNIREAPAHVRARLAWQVPPRVQGEGRPCRCVDPLSAARRWRRGPGRGRGCRRPAARRRSRDSCDPGRNPSCSLGGRWPKALPNEHAAVKRTAALARVGAARSRASRCGRAGTRWSGRACASPWRRPRR